MVCTLGGMTTILEVSGFNSFTKWFLTSFDVKRSNKFLSGEHCHHQALHHKLWCPRDFRTKNVLWLSEQQEVCVGLSVTQTNESYEGCHCSVYFRHESMPRWTRQKPDSTGNCPLNQISTITRDEDWFNTFRKRLVIDADCLRHILLRIHVLIGLCSQFKTGCVRSC